LSPEISGLVERSPGPEGDPNAEKRIGVYLLML